MRYFQGPTTDVVALAALVHAAMGYPKFGVNQGTKQTILPLPGQAIEEVAGVELRWAQVFPSPVDPNVSFYPVDEVNGPHADPLLLEPMFANVASQAERDLAIFPEPT